MRSWRAWLCASHVVSSRLHVTYTHTPSYHGVSPTPQWQGQVRRVQRGEQQQRRASMVARCCGSVGQRRLVRYRPPQITLHIPQVRCICPGADRLEVSRDAAVCSWDANTPCRAAVTRGDADAAAGTAQGCGGCTCQGRAERRGAARASPSTNPSLGKVLRNAPRSPAPLVF